ncbi:Metallophosphoesterase [Cystobacter fuscus DSM 2262]|uniref:Metallophosphoesterase n=1 Tax=Cystobacter fuscus (strain ATCC 25194 / DSM 2262 / NBRC 100088 / M29) TaxID=1242864 RepID=S9P6M8_CYSF2|nr:metallophosphoesterase [Cystobacter fuscus]EPX57882.1 Metallophosphoesterase [Cystobacter fuscus DSM 2262]
MHLRTLAHLSDLHLDLTPESDTTARALVESLLAESVDHVVVTGDLTHQGSQREYKRFRELFAPLLDAGRLTFIPGNHDRTGEDAGSRWMNGRKVRVEHAEGLYLVCVDSTGPHNRNYFACHGVLTPGVLDAVDEALCAAPRDVLTAVLLHHHVLPLPEESFPERLATRMGWPHASELALGAELVQRVQGRCDLILHGHRHVPREFDLGTPRGRGLRIYNSGSSTEMGRFRVFSHATGRLTGAPVWYRAALPPSRKRSSAPNVGPALQYLASQLTMALL